VAFSELKMAAITICDKWLKYQNRHNWQLNTVGEVKIGVGVGVGC
jgi:hypothetical protein